MVGRDAVVVGIVAGYICLYNEERRLQVLYVLMG